MAGDFAKLIDALATESVAFVIVGGIAVVAHGYPRVTLDLDVCYACAPDNLDRLARALAPFNPRLRGAPATLPFVLDARTLRNGLNFTLTTDVGDIDLLGELTGVGTFSDAVVGSEEIELYGHRVRILGLDLLERNKLAAAPRISSTSRQSRRSGSGAERTVLPEVARFANV